MEFYRKRGKRFFDMCCSGLLLLFSLPIQIAAGVLILSSMGRPLLFRQIRPGIRGKPFTLYKFRTMRNSRDARGQLLADAERLTAFGKFLRSTSLDELPELWNVLKGDMSMIGPRPLLMQYLGRYDREQARRHETKPGITGWAQVNGRNAISWDEKFSLDVWYVDHQSLRLDIRILAMTVWTLIRREGINQPGQATMEEFLGNSGKQAP
jgi:sugar transferase EpsL